MPIKELITHKLVQNFNPIYLEVINESHQHSVAPGSETHFKIVIVSQSFGGQSLINRHRAIYDLLKTEIANGVHALAIHAFSEQDWSEKQKETLKSPPCLGGSKKS